jgi:hypothetical protein
MTLKRKLAEFGFESNDDYEFALRCLLETDQTQIRCAELVGTVPRRKTAFANALAMALDYPHQLYHDFSKAPESGETLMVKLEDSDTGDAKMAKPLSPFERVLTEACAFSESGKTILVLDQLQLCDFSDQLRLFGFISTRQWSVANAAMLANAKNLLVFLVSTEALYHSLQKVSFRIFTDAGRQVVDFKPVDLGLPVDAAPLLERFQAVYHQLSAAPTLNEYKKILHDCDERVRTIEHLRTVLFGRMENLPREHLYASELEPALTAVVDEVLRLLGVEQAEL